jgi:hypothetical protein
MIIANYHSEAKGVTMRGVCRKMKKKIKMVLILLLSERWQAARTIASEIGDRALILN